MLPRRSRAAPVVLELARLLGGAALLCVLATACGGGSSSGKGGSHVGATELAAAERNSRFCQGLGVGGCQSVNTKVEGWLSGAHLDGSYAVGALDFAVVGCLNCHTYRSTSSQNLHAPDLTHIGSSKTQAQLIAELKCPTCAHPRSQMPSYRSTPKQVIEQLTAFLAASH